MSTEYRVQSTKYRDIEVERFEDRLKTEDRRCPPSSRSLGTSADERRQKTEDGSLKLEDRRPKTEDRSLKLEARSTKREDGRMNRIIKNEE